MYQHSLQWYSICSPARRLLVDVYAELVDPSSSFSAYGSAHKDFMCDMMVSLGSTRPHAKVSAELRHKLTTKKSKSTAKDSQIAERDTMLVDLRSENTTLKKNVATLTEERDAARKKLETSKYAKVEGMTAERDAARNKLRWLRPCKCGDADSVSENTAGADEE
jgi:hypothetical protein